MAEDDDWDDAEYVRTPPLTTAGFMSIADVGTQQATAFNDTMTSSDNCSSPEYADFADRACKTSPLQVPVKRKREYPSPIMRGTVSLAAGVPIPMEAIDVDPICAPMSLNHFHTAMTITATQIFETRGKLTKKPGDVSGLVSVDNSDAQSITSSTCTKASFASTVSGGSCYGFVPGFVPVVQPPIIVMWICRECSIMHPAEYKCCGKCCKKREEVELLVLPSNAGEQLNSPQQQAAAAFAAGVGMYSNPLAQAYFQQMQYRSHAFSPTCNGGGSRPSTADKSCYGASGPRIPNTSRRGENVKDNPQMQKTARDGQKHWQDKVQQMSAEPFAEDDWDDEEYVRTPPLTTTGFMNIADAGTQQPSAFTDTMSSDECSSPEFADFAARAFKTSPLQVPVKPERDPSPIPGGNVGLAADVPVPMEAMDVDPICAPMSLNHFHTAIPITTTQIFGTRGKPTKKPKDASGLVSVDNSDAQSIASSSSGFSSCTNASFASTVSGGSCYGFVPGFVPVVQPPIIVMWICRECSIMHPAEYKCCGKCCKKREEVELLVLPSNAGEQLNSPQQQAAAAFAAGVGMYSNPLAQAYFQQMQYRSHAFSPTCNGGGSRPSTADKSCYGASGPRIPNTSRRGENVKDNPQMQKTARDGQKHWQDKVKQMRADHEKAQTTLCCHEFTLQRYFCNARNLKCQKESFLLFLQKCTQEKLISPLPFVHPADDASGFLGWTGFRILPGCGDKFRAGVDGLFPETPKLNTLYHLFRRAGLVPEDWRRAWEGEVLFTWNPNRVS